jgi:predicted O-methyltransferase YrrM
LGAKRVAEFATSVGVSTIYFAAAIWDNCGDARETLRDLGGPVDFVLIDGWPTGDTPSLAKQVIDILAPQIRSGGILLNDNGEEDYLAFVRNPANRFRSMTLPLKGGTELSVKV